jgi:hypothetical protein
MSLSLISLIAITYIIITKILGLNHRSPVSNCILKMNLDHSEDQSQSEFSLHYLDLQYQLLLLRDLLHKHSSLGKANEIWFLGTLHF